MKMLLVGVNAKYIHSNLAIRYLKAYTKDLEYDCVIKEYSINDKIQKVVEEIIEEEPDVVGFSSYIWNADFIIHMCNLIKNIDDKIEILFGGPEVSFNSHDFLLEHEGEFLIEGEGEETYREFIEYKLGLRSLEEIKGLYYKEKNLINDAISIKYNGSRPLMDMNNIVFPYNNEEGLENKIIYYEASRGCPYSCKYCLSSTIHGVRLLDAERVKKELQYFMDKEIKLVKFVDRTFNCSRNFTKEIWNFIVNSNTNTTFHFEISAHILNKEELEILKRAPKGRIQLEIGVQTTNEKVLKNINRDINYEDIKERIAILKENNNIKCHLDLIAGLPGEDFNSFKNSFNDVHNLQPEELQLGFLKLLKGSPMREEAPNWGMAYSPYPPYEILKTKDISYKELILLKRVEEIVDKYYNSNKFGSIIKFFMNKFEDPFSFYYEFAMFFHEKGYFKQSISSVDYYKVFLEFNDIVLKDDNKILNEIVKFDYLKYNKKKWLPSFLCRYYDKKEENEIKSSKVYKDLLKDRDKVHIEKFSVDIIKFLKEDKIKEENKYYVFSLNDTEDIVEIVDTVNICD